MFAIEVLDSKALLRKGLKVCVSLSLQNTAWDISKLSTPVGREVGGSSLWVVTVKPGVQLMRSPKSNLMGLDTNDKYLSLEHCKRTSTSLGSVINELMFMENAGNNLDTSE